MLMMVLGAYDTRYRSYVHIALHNATQFDQWHQLTATSTLVRVDREADGEDTEKNAY